jgi:PPK2 family polyphosphate:nucleotide phosphotransferase
MDKDKAAELFEIIKPFRVKPGRTVVLAKDFDPGYAADYHEKDECEDLLKEGKELLQEYQARLAAQDTYGLLVIIQGLDAAGKDGLIKHVLSGVNPQGVSVHSFKAPSVEELDHEYLWRCAKVLPRRGDITIFNRSHYEEVLVVRVHPEILEAQRIPAEHKTGDIWGQRYREINSWERYLVDNGFRIVKLFLNLSKEVQRQRFLDRLEEHDKNWKFSAKDVKEREHWDEYQQAYSEMLSKTSTRWAPWYVIPADHKWFTRAAAAAAIVEALAEINPQFPVVSAEEKKGLAEAQAALEAEAPEGAKKKAAKSAFPGNTGADSTPTTQGEAVPVVECDTGASPENEPGGPTGTEADAFPVCEIAAASAGAEPDAEPDVAEAGAAESGIPESDDAAEGDSADAAPAEAGKRLQGRIIGFGEIELQGKRYRNDVVIEEGKIRKRKKKPSKAFRGPDGHTPLSIAEDIPWGAGRLVVGTGIDGALPVMAEVYEEADRRGIELVALPLEQALLLLGSVPKKEAFAVLHVTC